MHTPYTDNVGDGATFTAIFLAAKKSTAIDERTSDFRKVVSITASACCGIAIYKVCDSLCTTYLSPEAYKQARLYNSLTAFAVTHTAAKLIKFVLPKSTPNDKLLQYNNVNEILDV